MTDYTHLNSINVRGSVASSTQGTLIGSFDTIPTASDLNKGQLILCTRTYGAYSAGRYYMSNGAEWVLQSNLAPESIAVDAAVSTTSTNPVQNKVIAENFVMKEAGKGLSSEDYTSADKTKLAGIAEGAQVNVIEAVRVNGTSISPVSKAVNIDLSNYATKGDVSAIPKFSIQVLTGELPATGDAATIYLKPNSGTGNNVYDEYIFVNSKWEKIGTTETDLSGYVPTSRKVNGKPLTADVTLGAADVGALASGGTAARATADADGNVISSTYLPAADVLTATNASVSWASDSSKSGYPYKGTIALSGCTTAHIPIVSFATAQASSGNYCAEAESGTDAVYIWSKTDAAIAVNAIAVKR